ncbi:MAG TPA: SMI1/KNR4 family protein [Terriglobales bacterium]|nr:SMI1/KNR4 family protein [Terriglobales bacterium]
MIESLKLIIPPPSLPVECEGDWEALEAILGFEAPSDYREFIASYGSCLLDELIAPLNPFSANKYWNLLERAKELCDALRQLQSESQAELPLAVYPAKDGLFPWGFTTNGDVLYWLQIGAPSEWTTVVNADRDSEFEIYRGGMGAFLAATFGRQHTSRVFPEEFPSSQPRARAIVF